MESSEFQSYFSQFPAIAKLFDGVFSFDKIPQRLKLHHFIICNTDISTGEGKHWFCLYKEDKNTIECFDSLGLATELKKSNLLNACRFTSVGQLKINCTQVQSSSTDTCGKFCLMFIIERLHNPDMTFDDLMNEIFTDNCAENERNVEKFFNEIILDRDFRN